MTAGLMIATPEWRTPDDLLNAVAEQIYRDDTTDARLGERLNRLEPDPPVVVDPYELDADDRELAEQAVAARERSLPIVGVLDQAVQVGVYVCQMPAVGQWPISQPP